MDVGNKFSEFLEKNPLASVKVMDGEKTKAMIFDGALIVKISDVSFVRIGDEVFETDFSFYDKIFDLLIKNPLRN